jgi:hypothetical protein
MFELQETRTVLWDTVSARCNSNEIVICKYMTSHYKVHCRTRANDWCYARDLRFHCEAVGCDLAGRTGLRSVTV